MTPTMVTWTPRCLLRQSGILGLKFATHSWLQQSKDEQAVSGAQHTNALGLLQCQLQCVFHAISVRSLTCRWRAVHCLVTAHTSLLYVTQ